MDDSERDLRQWLEGASALRALERIARRVERRLAAGRINPTAVAPRESQGSADQISERINDLKGELVQYLLEKGAHFGPRLKADEPGMEGQLFYGFLNHLKDLVRSFQSDPYRYLYRRSREVLSTAAGILTMLKSGRYVVYSTEPANADHPPLTEEDLEAIAFPLEVQPRLDYQSVCRHQTMLALAIHFWQEASNRRGGVASWVDLRDFVDWLIRHVELPAAPSLSVDADGVDTLPASMAASCGETAEHLETPDAALLAADIRRQAACFFNRLTPVEKLVCFLRDIQELSWEQIAARTGHKGPSGPLYKYRLAANKLIAFIRELEQFSPEDFNPEEFRRFHREFLRILKESVSTP